MSDPTERDEPDTDPTTGLPDVLPGGPDDEQGSSKPLVEAADLDADDEG